MYYSRIVFLVGGTLTFLGLLWMLLPHAAHQTLLLTTEEESHLAHLLQGAGVAVIGVVLLIFGERTTSSKVHNRNDA